MANGTKTDPLWFKEAIIYEVSVRAFCDSNGDGIGDFPGLISKLITWRILGLLLFGSCLFFLHRSETMALM